MAGFRFQAGDLLPSVFCFPGSGVSTRRMLCPSLLPLYFFTFRRFALPFDVGLSSFILDLLSLSLGVFVTDELLP